MHIVLIILYLFSALSGAVYYTYLWQLKEYRLDRMMDGIRTRSGLHKVFPNFQLIKIVLIATGSGHYAIVQDVNIFYFYALLAFGLELFEFVIRAFNGKAYRPKKTVKAMFIVALTFLSMIVLGLVGAYMVASGRYDMPVRELLAMLLGMVGLILLVLSIFVPAISSAVVFAFNPITEHMKRKVILSAKRKLALNKIKVIGITGSFGKSSTKEFLYQILESHFPGKVFKTPGNTNVDIGVAQEILNGLEPEHEFAIIEMGAYKKGEIKAICDLVHPVIGVITAVSDQHLALFGSLKNIQDAKYELVESLPVDGIAFFNADSPGAMELKDRTKDKKTLSYASSGPAKLMALHVNVQEREIDFDIHGIKFIAAVFGKQNLPNLLAAIAVANECGMTFQEIARAVRKIKMPERIMNLKESISRAGDLLIIDDTYNANPEGVKAALDYLNNFKDRKKIFVFPGMLELGPKTDIEHIGVGEKIREICDFTVFTSTDFLKPLLIGLGKNFDESKYAICDSAEEIFRILNQHVQNEKAVILFESRGAESVMRELLK